MIQLMKAAAPFGGAAFFVVAPSRADAHGGLTNPAHCATIKKICNG